MQTPSRPIRIVLAILFVAACIGLRLVWLPYDPPGWLSWSSGVYTDEGFYTLDARHRVLFGTLAPGNFHDSYTAPLLSWIQTLWFREVGVGLVQARLLNVLFALLTIALFWDTLRRRSSNLDTQGATPLLGKGAERPGASISTAATVMLGLSPVYLFYNDLALQETPALFWIVLALWLLSLGRPEDSGESGAMPTALGRHVGPDIRIALAGACVIGAFATKSLSMIAAPAIVMAVWSSLLSKERVRARLIAFAIGLVLAGAAYLAVTWPHHAEIARMSKYYAQHQVLPHTATSLWLNIRRGFIGGEKGVVPYLLAMMPLTTILAVVAFRKRKPVCIDPVPVVWLACGLTFCLFSRYSPSRYYVLFLPALCWLAAIGWCRLSPSWRRVSLTLATVVSIVWIGTAWQHRTQTVFTQELALNGIMRTRPMIIGDFASELALGTELQTAPVLPGLANDDRPVEALDPYCISISHSPFWLGWWRKRYPAIIQPGYLWKSVTLGSHDEYVVDLYMNPKYVRPRNNAH